MSHEYIESPETKWIIYDVINLWLCEQEGGNRIGGTVLDYAPIPSQFPSNPMKYWWWFVYFITIITKQDFNKRQKESSSFEIKIKYKLHGDLKFLSYSGTTTNINIPSFLPESAPL